LGERPRVTLDREVDRELALGHLRDQVLELGEAGLRAEVVSLAGTAQEPEEPMELGDRLPTGRLDRAEHADGLLGMAVQYPPCGSGLDSHHAHVMGNDVVQLTGDPHALLEHRPAGLLLPLALELGRPFRQLPLPPRNERMATPSRHGRAMTPPWYSSRKLLATSTSSVCGPAKNSSRTTSPRRRPTFRATTSVRRAGRP
jgi:hypothetical protein